MRVCLFFLVTFLTGCSAVEVSNSEAEISCPSAGLEQKAAAKLSADIVASGKWVSAEPDSSPNLPIEVGRIQIIELKKGDLTSDQMIGIATASLISPDPEKVICPVSVPRADEERIFFIQRGQNKSLRVIDHEPMDTGI